MQTILFATQFEIGFVDGSMSLDGIALLVKKLLNIDTVKGVFVQLQQRQQNLSDEGAFTTAIIAAKIIAGARVKLQIVFQA